jgi:hypothetical protein
MAWGPLSCRRGMTPSTRTTGRAAVRLSRHRLGPGQSRGRRRAGAALAAGSVIALPAASAAAASCAEFSFTNPYLGFAMEIPTATLREGSTGALRHYPSAGTQLHDQSAPEGGQRFRPADTRSSRDFPAERPWVYSRRRWHRRPLHHELSRCWKRLRQGRPPGALCGLGVPAQPRRPSFGGAEAGVKGEGFLPKGRGPGPQIADGVVGVWRKRERCGRAPAGSLSPISAASSPVMLGRPGHSCQHTGITGRACPRIHQPRLPRPPTDHLDTEYHKQPGTGAIERPGLIRRAAAIAAGSGQEKIRPVPWCPRRPAQRKQLRPHLARRPHPSPRARGGCHHSGPPPLRPAARRPVPLAERRRRTRPDRATGRAQHHHAARRLHPLHRRPGRHHQPADRTSPSRPEPSTSPDNKRFREPPVAPAGMRQQPAAKEGTARQAGQRQTGIFTGSGRQNQASGQVAVLVGKLGEPGALTH